MEGTPFPAEGIVLVLTESPGVCCVCGGAGSKAHGESGYEGRLQPGERDSGFYGVERLQFHRKWRAWDTSQGAADRGEDVICPFPP